MIKHFIFHKIDHENKVDNSRGDIKIELKISDWKQIPTVSGYRWTRESFNVERVLDSILP
jgi:hypothetical protein